MAKQNAARGTRARVDGWENQTTGLGMLGKDKRRGSNFVPDQITQEMADDLWEGDDMLARAVETPIDEMLREGYFVKIEQDDEGGQAPEPDSDEEKQDGFPFAKKGPPTAAPAAPAKPKPQTDWGADTKKISEAVEAELRRLNVTELLREAGYYSRAFGGGAIILGGIDGKTDLSKPLNENTIQEIKEFSVRTPRELQPKTYYSDVRAPKYGQIATYYLVPIDTPPGSTAGLEVIHESRVIRVDGAKTTRRKRLTGVNQGWDKSIFVRIAQIAADFQHGFQGAAILIQDFAPATLKIKGLAKILTAKNGADGISTRAAALALSRSIARTSIIDAEEEYKRETVSVAGLGDLLDKLALRYAAACRMPVTLLMGQSPAGLNATGAADMRFFYDRISADQERVFKPVLLRIAKLIFLAKKGPTKGKVPENWDVEFEPLYQLTDLEKEDLRLKVAQRDQIYIDAQVVTPEEIAKSRFGGDGWSAETVVDLDLREKMANEDQHQEQRLGAPSEHDTAMNEVALEQAKNPPPVAAPGKAKPPPFGKR